MTPDREGFVEKYRLKEATLAYPDTSPQVARWLAADERIIRVADLDALLREKQAAAVKANQFCGGHVEEYKGKVIRDCLACTIDALQQRVSWLEKGRAMLVAVGRDGPKVQAWLAAEPPKD